MSRMGFTEDWLPPPSASANYFLLNSDHTDSAKTLANKWKWSTSSLNHIYCKFIFSISICSIHSYHMSLELQTHIYDKLSDVAKAWVQRRSDFQSGFRVLKRVFWTFSYLYLGPTMWFHAKKLLKTLKFWKSLNSLYKSGQSLSKKRPKNRFHWRAVPDWQADWGPEMWKPKTTFLHN